LYETKVSFKDNNISLSMPLSKVDVEKRTVHGFATLDNLDKQDDIVTREASVDAFTRFKGNIREQHDPHKAVGKVVDFKSVPYYDEKTDKQYEGVFVSAYVSKGAEDTWQKVLDGTLTGFSIGGTIDDTENAYDEDLDKVVRIVHKYDLLELSLVDNPANQLANVVSIEKTDDGVVVKTPLVKGEIENVFWCPGDNLVVVKSVEDENCAVCDSSMENVGFVEANDIDKKTSIRKSLEQFKKKSTVKEAKNMAEDTVVEKDATEEEVSEVVEEVEKADTVEEEVAEVEEEVSAEELDKASDEADTNKVVEQAEVAKAAEDQIASLQASLVSSLSTLTDTVSALNDKIDQVSKAVSGVETSVTEIKGSAQELGKRVDAVEDTTAFQKSADLGEIEQIQEVRKGSPWGGRFLTNADL